MIIEQIDDTGYGYSMEMNMPKDYIETSYPYTSIRATEMAGAVTYDGYVNNTNINTVNHWSVYAHEKINIAGNNIDFSASFSSVFSLSGTFGISFESCYEQLAEEHTWRRF